MHSTHNPRVAWLLLLPMLVIMAVVTGFPLVNTVWLAFTDASLTGKGYDWNWSGSRISPTSRMTGIFARRSGTRSTSPSFRSRSRWCSACWSRCCSTRNSRPHAGAGAADPALGAADHRQRHDVAADLQSRIRQPQRAADADSACIDRLSLLARRSGKTAMNAVILADVWKNYPLIALIVLGRSADHSQGSL